MLADGIHRDAAAGSVCIISYEAAGAFDSSMRTRRPDSTPLLWMAGFARRTQLDDGELSTADDARPVLFGPWTAEMDEQAYERAFTAVRDQLAAGNAYQVNLTQRYRSRLLEAPTQAALRALFARLVHRHAPPYAALIDTGEIAVLSLSPETFFEHRNGTVRSRPMKGTAPRGITERSDAEAAQRLVESEKERAENLMIVDMIRNDMGRIAQVGTVRVPRLFTVERYPTVLQMTSEVTARTDAGVEEVIAALFPCASITGAPKVSAMSIIADVERSPRGVYTGTIGSMLPAGGSHWSVAIRTLVLHRSEARAEYGSGGGIVWDSRLESELAELRLKARALEDTAPPFGLLETMLLRADGAVYLLDRHLARMRRSAHTFGFAFDEEAVRKQVARAPLDKDRAGITGDGPWIMRLVLAQMGTITLEVSALADRPLPDPLPVRLAHGRVDSHDLLLRHKTTDRRVYQDAAGERQDADQAREVFLLNERGELTEGTITNIVLELDGKRYTPPDAAGLLPGCYREELLARGEITERTLTPCDLYRADAVWAINSVRGMLRCTVVGGEPTASSDAWY